VNDPYDEARYPIRTVARRTGLTPHVLRAWERRYNVVEPARPNGGMRLYSDADIVRIRLLKRLTELGHGIGRVARLSVPELAALLGDDEPDGETIPEVLVRLSPDAAKYLSDALQSLETMDGRKLHAILTRAVVALSGPDFLDGVVIPLLRHTGELWAEGRICPAHEHVLSVQVGRVLGWLAETIPVPPGAPSAIAVTPVGQRHEFGALLAGVVAAEEGWHVTFLGSDLPARDIGAAVGARNAKLVLLSVVFGESLESLESELQGIRSSVGDGVEIIIGGQGARNARAAIRRSGARWISDYDALRFILRQLNPSRSGE